MPSLRLAVPLLFLVLWGFLQLGTGATVYRYATLREGLKALGLGATAFCGSAGFRGERQRETLLACVTAFGATLAGVGILTSLSSADRILWTFDSPYPDTWGPFLSRNNFAQFLELCLPAALWLAVRRDPWVYGMAAAVIYVASLASASRAGALLLTAQLAGFSWLYLRSGRRALIVLLGGAGLAAAVGVDQLQARMLAPNWLGERLSLWASTLDMISRSPWLGYGLGNFASVYPEFARFDSGYIIEHAHNQWLEWIAEGGIGFGLVWFALLGRSLHGFRECWRWGVPSVLLHACVDFPFTRLGVAGWAFLLLGAADRRPEKLEGEVS